MRIVDFSTFPDHAEYRNDLIDSLDAADLDDAQRTDPLDPASAAGVGYPDDLDDDQLRERAEDLRYKLEGELPEDATVRFTLSDGRADIAGGSPAGSE